MSAPASCASNSRRSRRARSSGRARSGSLGARAAFLVAIATLATGAGCARQPSDLDSARRAADRFLVALAADDLEALRAGSTCILASGALRGGTILRADPIRTIALGSLDSLAANAADGERAGEASLGSAVEGTADSLYERSRALARRSVLYRNAVRAASLSLDGAEPASDARLRTCRMRVRLRWAGSRVGPTPVDREHVLRALAAPGGRWIVFSIYAREDDPRPEPI